MEVDTMLSDAIIAHSTTREMRSEVVVVNLMARSRCSSSFTLRGALDISFSSVLLLVILATGRPVMRSIHFMPPLSVMFRQPRGCPSAA